MWQHLTEQSTTNRALRHSVVQICHDIPLVLHEETAPRLARVGNVHGESLLQHVEVEAYTSHHPHTATLLLSQLPVEEHLVVSIVDVVRVEEGRHHTASEHAVPTPHAPALRPRLLLAGDGQWPHLRRAVVHEHLQIHHVLRLTRPPRAHLEDVEVLHHALFLDERNQALFVSGNNLPSIPQISIPSLQLVVALQIGTAVDGSVGVLEELEEDDVAGVAEEVGLAHEAVVQVGGGEHVDVHEEVVRGGDGLDADVAQHVVGVQALVEVHAFRALEEVGVHTHVVHDVQRERDRVLAVAEDELERLLHLRLVHEHHRADRSVPARQQVGEAVHAVQSTVQLALRVYDSWFTRVTPVKFCSCWTTGHNH